jgi:soluble lytic murein transglycosylase-like protein
MCSSASEDVYGFPPSLRGGVTAKRQGLWVPLIEAVTTPPASPAPPFEKEGKRRGFARPGIVRCALAALVLTLSPLAAASDSPSQLVVLANAYEHGEGVPKDPNKAADLYCEAARDGDAEAQYRLGWMYANARGVERDDAAATALFKRAATQGHEYANRMLRYVSAARDRLPSCMRASVVPAHWPAHKREVAMLVLKLAHEYAVRPQLALAVVEAESNFDPRARSPKNALGLMQLIPETAKRFGVKNALDPNENVRGGLAYLRWLLSYYRGSVELAVAAYNAGEDVVDRFRGVPPYPETRDYVRRIMSRTATEYHPFDANLTKASPVAMSATKAKR